VKLCCGTPTGNPHLAGCSWATPFRSCCSSRWTDDHIPHCPAKTWTADLDAADSLAYTRLRDRIVATMDCPPPAALDEPEALALYVEMLARCVRDTGKFLNDISELLGRPL
jgi:hypothetical protein